MRQGAKNGPQLQRNEQQASFSMRKTISRVATEKRSVHSWDPRETGQGWE